MAPKQKLPSGTGKGNDRVGAQADNPNRQTTKSAAAGYKNKAAKLESQVQNLEVELAAHKAEVEEAAKKTQAADTPLSKHGFSKVTHEQRIIDEQRELMKLQAQRIKVHSLCLLYLIALNRRPEFPPCPPPCPHLIAVD